VVVKRKEVFFFTFPLDSKNRRFALLQRGLFFGGDFGECRFSHFSRTKMSQKFETENDRWWGGQSESAYISLEIKIAILLLLTSQH